ncbi:MAG: hypothetical protein LBD15_02580 [Holosporales bacterium]|jgi:zinc protease|nr:hypothetical protein [Holosporales bacterium]
MPFSVSAVVQEISTPKGIRVWFLQDSRSLIISIKAIFRGRGSVSDSKGKEGCADLYAAMMLISSHEIRNRMEEIGSYLSFSNTDDVFCVCLTYLKEHQIPTLQLARLVLISPTFKQEDLARVQKHRITAEKQENPTILRERAVRRAAYPNHPYARHCIEESLKSLTKQNLVACRRHLTKDCLLVVIVGAVTTEEAAACVDQLFGTLPEKSQVTKIPIISH